MRTPAAVLSLTLLAACGGDDDEPFVQPEVLTDQSGAVFGWECDEAMKCRLSRLEDSPPAPVEDCGPELEPTFSYSWGHLIELSAVCADSKGWVSFPRLGRLVVCEADGDCPVIGNDAYECNAGYCKNSAQAELFDDLPNRWAMEQICLGDTPRYEPYEASPELAAAIDEACPGGSDDPCLSLPAGCRDPRG
ncbi:hypothetical protein [Nannocystis bainbridge]|uniref:Lipoprotein n=1 Tax=Nannocystis bainbridge TaxID=2995303 RepID=A0ABT5DVN3_9BACT|nr:hypothetical protein [Nannocystis bainbridge]MDC0717208.1 hypothetical protein [Nannocystis bainbridge]